MNERIELARALHSIGAIKFGAYKQKSGNIAPLFLDLRILVSYPKILRDVSWELAHLLSPLKFDRIAVIPYAGMPIGTALALEMDRPMIYPRREKRDYGAERVIEGEYRPGETAVLIDDLIITGEGKLAAIETLRVAKINVRDIVVLVDPEQGGSQILGQRGYQLHSVFKASELMHILHQAQLIQDAQYQEVINFITRTK